MDLMVINENKIKLVTGVEGVFFTTLHISPKCLCTTISEKNGVSQNINK